MTDNIYPDIAELEDLYTNNVPVYRSAKASIGTPDRSFVGWNTDTSVKSTYNRGDYNYFRMGNTTIHSRANMLKVCKQAYKRVGAIQNVINLMSDFGSKGIRFRHKDKKIEKLCQTWGDKVGLAERSERFLNYLYKLGVVIAYESLGRLDANKSDSKYIPLKFTFLDPSSVRIKEEGESVIPENPTYELVQYSSEVDRINNQNAASVPEVLENRIAKTLNSERLSVYHYRKDDWEFWGTPITYAILDQLEMLEKLQLADISALDGAIQQVRLWTIGKITDNPQTTFMPTKPMIDKWRNVLANSVNGGTMDIVAGPEVSFTESSTSVHQFLGKSKFEPTMDAIYDGLGIPSALRSGGKEGSNANPISLKTLIERLNYGRLLLVEFWNKQLKKLFKAVGIEKTDLPVIEFDYMVLTDEAAEKKLLIDLIDRDVVDNATVLERFHMDPDIVEHRLKIEAEKRGETSPEKAGPFHNAQVKDDIKKQLVATNAATPAEIGVKVNVPEKEQTKRRVSAKKAAEKPKPTPGTTGRTPVKKTKTKGTGGRPKNTTETRKRNKKGAGKAKASIDMTVWASTAQKQISDIVTPVMLSVYEKKNVRSLSVEETNVLEIAKANVLFQIEPFTQITEELVAKATETPINRELIEDLQAAQKSTQETLGRELSVDEKRNITSLLYSEVYNGDSNSEV